MLYELASDLSNKAKITSALSDTFARKASATIYKRTASVWQLSFQAPPFRGKGL